jgi:preprotein translocase SecF subunit
MRIIENRRNYFLFSIFVLLVGVAFMVVNLASGRGAFNYDVEFSGGTSFTIDIGADFNNDDVMDIVREISRQDAPQIQKLVGTNQVMIRLRSVDQETRSKLIDAISEKYNITQDAFTYSDISATISGEMQSSAILAVVVACAAMLLYVSIRFRDVRMGAAAILALLHDALVMIAFYAILRIPLNYSFIAAILTILGYSINSTIVMFDRMRENKVNMRKPELTELINVSITQTLRRSIFTSATVFIVVLILYILGVSSIKEFSLPIIIGVITGAYSSIFLAGSFWYMFSKKPQLAGSSSTAASRVITAKKEESVKIEPIRQNKTEKPVPLAANDTLKSTPRKKRRKHR